MLQTPTSHYFTTRSGTKFHYLQGGEPLSPLLVCLHGLGGSTETFLPLVPFFPQDYNIILVDFQGFGKTPLSDGQQISIAGHVADLSDLIASLQGPQTSGIVFIGHSLGAIVALQYAARYPDQIKGLALLGTGRAAGHIPAARKRMLDLADAVRKKGICVAAEAAAVSNFYEDTPERAVDPAVRETVRSEVSASDPEAYAQTCEAIVDLEHKDPAYAKIQCPVLFVAGDKDIISPVQKSVDLSALIGGKSWVDVVKSGHQPILQDLPGVTTAIDGLLQSVN
ncbi:hypothetical protein ACJBU6_08826 [Exserohilum turcicum]